jgi:hypothetical protein
MYGRSCLCLLVIALLIPLPVVLCGQTNQSSPAQIAADLPITAPRLLQPPVPRPPGAGPAPAVPRPPVVLPGTIGLPQITRAARTIFSGTVTAIALHPATGGQSVETVAITFRVENAIRGVMPDDEFTILQWIGLWSGGQRYRVGERVLLFLYPPSKLGLSSSVAGPFGRFSLDTWGRVLLTAQQLSAFRADPVLGGKSRVRFSDFALAVRRASEDEEE